MAAAIQFCVLDALLGRVPLLAFGFFFTWFCTGLDLGLDQPRAFLTPTVMFAPGTLLVLRMLATGFVLSLRTPFAPTFARITMRWVRAHQVLVAIALPTWLVFVDGPCLAFYALVSTLAVTSVVWSRSARLEAAAATCADSSDAHSERGG